jgi:hypothetical protein
VIYEAGRILDAEIAQRIFGYTLDYEFADVMGGPSVPTLRDQYDEWGLLPHYSTDIAAAWLVVEKMHAEIDPAKCGPYNYLTLVCLGRYAGWAASFDFNPGVDWYESMESYPFAAHADTPALAICLTALKTVDQTT